MIWTAFILGWLVGSLITFLAYRDHHNSRVKALTAHINNILNYQAREDKKFIYVRVDKKGKALDPEFSDDPAGHLFKPIMDYPKRP